MLERRRCGRKREQDRTKPPRHFSRSQSAPEEQRELADRGVAEAEPGPAEAIELRRTTGRLRRSRPAVCTTVAHGVAPLLFVGTEVTLRSSVVRYGPRAIVGSTIERRRIE